MSAWQEYKKKLGETRPWDFLDPNVERATEEESEKRFNICLECPEIINTTKQCKQCGCFMRAKTKLKNATCPLNKW
jgi:hypothetical protein